MESGSQSKTEPYVSNVALERANTTCYLVKVPTFVYDEWLRHDAGSPLGSLVIKSSEGKNQLYVRMAQTDTEDIPAEYELVAAPQVEPLLVLSEDTKGRVAVEGRVSTKVDMRALNMTELRSTVSTRTDKASASERKHMMHYEVNMLDRRPAGVFTNTITGNKRKRDESGFTERRERLDKDVVLERVFKAFEEKDSWGLQELNDRVKQPVQWLKEVMKPISKYHHAGPLKGQFELHPEYRPTKKPRIE